MFDLSNQGDFQERALYKKISEQIKRISFAVPLAACSATFAVEAQAEDKEISEEIVVQGVRGSLKRSLDLKRDAIGVVEGISAEDIGKFPDLNIADALQRIPGVTLERDFASNGEGRRINVRGLPSAFIQTTLNGITAASSATDGSNAVRAFDFDIFASELFSAATVSKTPTADISEGGLSATVNLQTPRALDYNERKFVISASTQFADLDDGGGPDPRVALLFSDTFNDGKAGISFSAAYSDTAVRGDWTQGFRFGDTGGAFLNNTLNGADRVAGTADDLTQADLDSLGTTVNGSAATLEQLQDIASDTIAPLLPRVGPNISERETLGVTLGFQFRPSEDVEFSTDLLYATFDDTQYRGTIDGLTGFGRRGVVPLSLTVADGVLSGATLDNITQRTESVEDAFENEFMHLTVEGKWNINDRWNASAQFGYSTAESDELRRTYLFQNTGEFTYDLSVPESPQFFGANFDYLDPDDYVPGGFRFRPRSREDEQTSVRFDLERVFDEGVLSSVKVGVRYADKEVSQQRGERRDFDTSALDFDDFALSARELAPGFLGGAAAGTPTDFLLIDPVAGDAFLPRSLVSTVPVDPLSTWTVSEESTAFYLKTLWAPSWGSVDLGVRIVRTEGDSIGSQVSGGVPEAVSFPSTYTNVLPNLNAKFNLDENVVLRFSANKAIARPTLGRLSPGTSIQPTTLSASAGNPELDPFEASQYDLSLEWYFAEEGLLAATFFYKDIASFITTGITQEVITGTNLVNDDGENVSGSTFSVTRPINGEGGELTGLELSYQQPFGETGFGMLANTTISESEGEVLGQTSQLVGHSELTYNLLGYYDKDGVNVRLAYSFRSDYLETIRQGDEQRVDDRQQLDLSIGYDLNDSLTLTFDAINLNGEDFYSFHRNTGLNRLFIDQEPVYLLGARYNFQ